MRADRLLALMGLLRQHDRLSATELARRLDVSSRTVLRDLDALSLAGVPVYAERGRSGGFSLLAGYRPDVEDLSGEEARALFVAGGAGVADALGLGDAFTQALRKLSTGMPEHQIGQVGHAMERIVIDPGGWGGSVRHPPALTTAFDAVQRDQRLLIHYHAVSSGQGGRRTVDPWGIVLAGTTWYLIAAHRGRPHTYRISRIERAEIMPAPVRRPARLDLLATWQELRDRWQERPSYPIELRVERAQADLVLRQLRFVLRGEPAVDEIGHHTGDEETDQLRIRAEVTTLRGVVGMLLGFGAWVQVIEPPELRALMRQVAHEVLATTAASQG